MPVVLDVAHNSEWLWQYTPRQSSSTDHGRTSSARLVAGFDMSRSVMEKFFFIGFFYEV